ncbi:VOC family protein [Micromonospora sp. KC207]|uniref:VOC family protein n=1 Tax=Micromonospora sp. KC207 TaxID=2530377 RepID=UPI001FB78CFE|nr:VOC family protein [Micromonospora sp. KC207]
MALSWKLVVDSTNAPALADFWAAALDYEVEDPSALVEQLLAAGHIGDEAVIEHRGRKTFRGYAAIRHPEDPFDETSGVGRGRRLLFQDVPEGKRVEPRTDVGPPQPACAMPSAGRRFATARAGSAAL